MTSLVVELSSSLAGFFYNYFIAALVLPSSYFSLSFKHVQLWETLVMIPTRGMASVALRPGLRPSIALRPYRAPTATLPWRRIDAGLVLRPASRAWESTASTGDKESGHIDVESNESVLFFDSKLAPQA